VGWTLLFNLRYDSHGLGFNGMRFVAEWLSARVLNVVADEFGTEGQEWESRLEAEPLSPMVPMSREAQDTEAKSLSSWTTRGGYV